MGVPQVSILSLILFTIKINKDNNLSPEINISLYVNNFLISYSSKNMAVIERKIQPCINKISKWTIENKFKISNNETKCMHFCQIYKMHNPSVLIVNGTKILITHQYKFLGITLNWKLLFIPHIKQLRLKCNSTIQLLRAIAHRLEC